MEAGEKLPFPDAEQEHEKRKENIMKKRVVSLLLCLIMALSLIPTVAFAAEPVAGGQQSVEQLDTLAGDPQATSLITRTLGWKYAKIEQPSTGSLAITQPRADEDLSNKVTVTIEKLLGGTENMNQNTPYETTLYKEVHITSADPNYYIAYVAFCCIGPEDDSYNCTAPLLLRKGNKSTASVSMTMLELSLMQSLGHASYCWLMVMVKPIEETPTPDPTGTLTVTKNVVAPDGVTVPDNFTFTIKKDDTVIDANFAVPANGSKSLTNLTLGNYTVTENASTIPAGYSLATKYGSDENATSATANVTANGATVTVTNTYDRIITGTELANANLVINKVDLTANNKLLPGAEFKLEDSNKNVITATPDGKGTYTFSNLKEGTYTLTETKAPADYINSNTTWAVTVTKDTQTEPTYKLNDAQNGFIAVYNSIVTVSKTGEKESIPTPNNTLTVTNAPKNATTVKINITKNVKVTGNTQPTTMPAFTFNINVGTKTLKAVSLTPKLVNGAWTVSETVDVVVPYDDFNANGEATLTISEVDGKLANWKYDGTKYTLTIKQQVEIAPPVSTSATLPAVPVYSFTNEYTYTYTPTTRPSDPIRRQPTTTTTKPVKSVKTGDMGIALYAVTSLLSLSGTALLIKKRKDEK